MVTCAFGGIEFLIPNELSGDEIAEEGIIYQDIATFLTAIPEVIKEHPRLKESIKSDIELLKSLADLGHIVAG